MTKEELRQIWGTIAGPRPQIITLVPYKRELVSPAPRMGVYWKYSELATHDSPLPTLYFNALTLNEPRTVLPKLASINNILLVEPAFSPAAHANFNWHLLRGEYLREMARQGGEGEGRESEIRVAFHRLTLLLNMKLTLGLAPQEEYGQGNDLAIGDAALLANDFLGENHCDNDRDLILETLPVWEVYNPRDIAYSMARYDILIRDYLSGDDPLIRPRASRLGIDTSRFEGLLLDEYVTLMFGIHSLLRHDKNCIFLAGTVARNLRIAQDSINAFLQSRALSVQGFREHFSARGWTAEQFEGLISNPHFVTDTTQLRRYPIIRLDENRCLVTDILFVIELLTSGLYWSIFDNLAPSRREDFSSLWGNVFELYMVGLFRHFYPGESEFNPFKADVNYEIGGTTGQIDALLDYGNETIIFEIKSSLLTLNAKCSRDWDALERDLRRKFIENEHGAPKALRQLARTATFVARGQHLSGHTPEHVFPVLVVDEKAMECLGMNSYLNQLFRGFLDEDVARRIRPLTIMSVDELEELFPYVEQRAVTWQEVLRSRFTGDRISLISVHQALYNITRDKDTPILRNDYLLGRFEQMFRRMGDQYVTDDD